MENENLVYSIINKYSSYGDKDDLYQVGMMGLINASLKFDPNIGVKFSTYAYKYILGEVAKYIRENNSFKISRDTLRLKSSIEKSKDLLRQKLLREPTTLELSLILEIDEEKIEEIEKLQTKADSLDYCFEDNEDSLYNVIQVEEKQICPGILDLKEELSKLPNEEKQIIYSRYYYDMTQNEVSKRLGISQVQVSRKETKVLEKLKSRL
ncbi:MAG: sigma-70 family RNA polymerase sigma factor [bacterium]|nr:sigma-70 family RNA polymerase sigma factor [bacterium]